MCHVDVRVLNKLLKTGELSYWLPSHGSLFLLTHRLTDSVLLQLHNEETRRDFTARHIFSLRFVRTSISIYQANGSVRSFPPRYVAELRANESLSGSQRPGQPHKMNQSLGCSGCECPCMDFFCTLLMSVSDSLW